MTLDLQRVFESLVIPFLNSCPGAEAGHIYGTRRALGKLATSSKRHHHSEEGRTPSISSSESFASSSLATARPQRRRYPKRALMKSTTGNRVQTRSTSQEWSDAEEEQQSLVDEGDSGGRRSISVDASISSEELLPSISAPRRETRSMAKRRTRKEDKDSDGTVRGGGVVPYSRENGFGMTLRTRGTKRKFEDSGSEESGSEVEENDQDDESESEAESLDVEQEEEDEEEEEEEAGSMTSSFRTRSSRLRTLGASKVQRKRLRRSSDSDEDLTYKPSKFLIRSSRSGRLVKANTKYT